MMIYRSKAPFRIGLAGGGTDVSPYSELYGGAILNATISFYAHTSLELLNEPKVIFESIDQACTLEFPSGEEIKTGTALDLQVGIYNRLLKEKFIKENTGIRLTTSMDVPAGSGLGTSSTLMVSILKAFTEYLSLPFGDYDIAHLAFDIERNDLKLAGGKQDQYAATFGGVNFMEFYANDKVIVNPLRIKREYLHELENNIVLFFTSSSRSSSAIIQEQQKNVKEKNTSSIEAMHQLKDQANWMKEALLKGQLDEIGRILDFGFRQKKQMAQNISNTMLEEIYDAAIHGGATGGKISGAGGGGFMFFYCPGNTRYKVIKALENFKGYFLNYQFTTVGANSWRAGK
jgi:D-glycero-alpha-D-manno-heptose-7-phosphate kinase